MIRASISALLLGVLAAPAFASDPRLVEHEYDPAEIVRIDGKARVQATIRFSESEKIENVAIGDSRSWQVTPNKRANLLFVKPLQANAATNMTVVTSRRTYLFDLVASPRSKPVYVVSFTYPEGETAAAEAARLAEQETASSAEIAAATDPYAVVDPATLNFAWASRGDKELLPERAYDDGDATFLMWPSGAAVPAILIVDEDGTEGPVNFTVRGDTVIVDGVPSEIILKSGKDRAVLTHDGPARPKRAATDDASLAQIAPSAREKN
ncbi:TrbG/VirB9 family P-type conjugative transfer protein [Altererythrobacter lutimaris]|uniref:TrbG/VirB9 family P-type conjugative transfer protein n=1 Tax=Altererythrobacter lutimaris TaxID=2743979 RepID=A0A850HDT4_9SPHN|nr:TrbG/VirB9 family P-type conjugative transfer protein [Altererythrobacter lutimaris]NVE94928.1 TrbG/VirB9 family P-type conjugative transfer protein [Altererythrobacter lutimaris]